MTRAHIGLGSNVGDRMSHLRAAVTALRGERDVGVMRASSVYETDPVGPPQRDFLNAVVEVETDLGPRALVRVLKSIERQGGRRPAGRWGPREVDLDLLVYGEAVVEDDELRVPHPLAADRAFVLVPLAEVDPLLEIPGRGRVRDLLARTATAGVRKTGPLL